MTSLVVGNASGDADFRVDDPYVSSRHCRLWRDERGQHWVEDLGSVNGTYLDAPAPYGRRVMRPTRIGPGSLLYVGRTLLPWRAG